jgi:hypothetical protein
LTVVIPNIYEHSGDDSFTLTLHPDGKADQVHFGLAAK